MMDTPVRNKDFFGRESILQLLDLSLLPSEDLTFSSESDSQKYVVLCGMGGLGKTSIAIEFAFRRRDKFDAVFWIRADEVSKLEQDFSQIASKLGLEKASEPRNPTVSLELAKGWLANAKKVLNQESDIVGQSEAKWLLIFDNADRPDILQDYYPISGNGSILVTSRDPLSKTSPSIAQVTIDVEPFGDEEAATFLQYLSHVKHEEDISFRIAQKLGGLPLALCQMAAIIRYQYLSFSEFLERWEDEADRKELLGLDVGAPRQEARGNIASIWAIEHLESHAKTIMEICALLDPDCIQERLFTGGTSSLNHLDDYPKRMFTYATARADLLKRSLVKRNEEKKEFWIHRVLQDSIKAQMSTERMRTIFSAAVTLVYTAWGITSLDKRHDISLSKSREGLFPHALSLKNTYERLHGASELKADVQLAFLLNEAGWWQHERGNSHDIKPLLTLALDICEQNPGQNTAQLLGDIHYGLSAVANETNDGEACLRHTQVLLKMRLQAFEENGIPDLRLAVAHNESGIAWVMTGEFDNAIAAFKSSIQVYQGLEEYWLSMDTNPLTNMGFTHWVKGDLVEASAIFEQLLRDRALKFGVNDTESYRTGRVLHGLGNVRLSQGYIQESEDLHQRALAHYQTTIGNDHHKTADLCHRVAQHCMRRGETENAITLIDQALRVWRRKESIYIPELARTTFLKAKLQMQSGSEIKAAALFKEARSLRNSIQGAPKKADADLKESDFDRLVTFFSR